MCSMTGLRSNRGGVNISAAKPAKPERAPRQRASMPPLPPPVIQRPAGFADACRSYIQKLAMLPRDAFERGPIVRPPSSGFLAPLSADESSLNAMACAAYEADLAERLEAFFAPFGKPDEWPATVARIDEGLSLARSGKLPMLRCGFEKPTIIKRAAERHAALFGEIDAELNTSQKPSVRQACLTVFARLREGSVIGGISNGDNLRNLYIRARTKWTPARNAAVLTEVAWRTLRRDLLRAARLL